MFVCVLWVKGTKREPGRKREELLGRTGPLMPCPLPTQASTGSPLQTPHAHAAARLRQQSAQLWQQKQAPSFSQGDLNFWEATNSPQSHNAKELPEWGKGAGKGKIGSLTDGNSVTLMAEKQETVQNASPISPRVWKKPTRITGKINSDKLLRRLV